MRIKVSILLIAITLPALAVIQNGILNFTPVVGANRYTLWRNPVNTARFDYLASFTNVPYQVTAVLTTGDKLHVRVVTTTNINGAIIYTESDLGFVVTPPETQGTNELRIIPYVNGIMLQSRDSFSTPWTNVYLFSNVTGTGSFKSKEFLRTLKTNLVNPPLPGN